MASTESDAQDAMGAEHRVRNASTRGTQHVILDKSWIPPGGVQFLCHVPAGSTLVQASMGALERLRVPNQEFLSLCGVAKRAWIHAERWGDRACLALWDSAVESRMCYNTCGVGRASAVVRLRAGG